MDRRTFIMRSGGTLAAVSASSVVNAVIPETPLKSHTRAYTETDWVTIATVQNHLFPSEADDPGSVEIKALQYLHDFLSNPATDPTIAEFILTGTRQLQTFSQQERQKTFIDLSLTQRETVLRAFEQLPEGRRWLVNILNYILEALLTDPVYGGNPNGIGWKWLEHRAGQPRPPANKRYWLL